MTQLLGHARRKMFRVGLPAVLDDLDEDGALRATEIAACDPPRK